jgi:hypothetical protein
MSTASVELTKYVSDYKFDPDVNRGWGIMVRAKGIGMDSEIFIYHRMPESEVYEGDMFEAVASVNQYYEIPSYTPKDNGTQPEGELVPYYKRNQLEVFARSVTELEEIWEYIKTDVSRLVADYNANLKMKSNSTVLVAGGLPQVINEYDNRTALVLAWEPAGSWDGQAIVNTDTSKKGWLPVSELENTISGAENRMPQGAKWFYNKGADSNFEELTAGVTNTEEVFLDMNGFYLLQGSGGAYQLTGDTLYWMENVNASIEGISKNPWPDDYIEGIDVAVEPVLTLSAPS